MLWKTLDNVTVIFFKIHNRTSETGSGADPLPPSIHFCSSLSPFIHSFFPSIPTAFSPPVHTAPMQGNLEEGWFLLSMTPIWFLLLQSCVPHNFGVFVGPCPWQHACEAYDRGQMCTLWGLLCRASAPSTTLLIGIDWILSASSEPWRKGDVSLFFSGLFFFFFVCFLLSMASVLCAVCGVV